MTRREEARFDLRGQHVYIIQGEPLPGEERPPPAEPIREWTEFDAIEAYMKKHGKRRVRSFVRAKSFTV